MGMSKTFVDRGLDNILFFKLTDGNTPRIGPYSNTRKSNEYPKILIQNLMFLITLISHLVPIGVL